MIENNNVWRVPRTRRTKSMVKIFKQFINFTKIEHTVFSLPLLYAGAYIGNNYSIPPIKIVLLILTAGVGARVLGMAMNRILDRGMDAKNPRTKNRELPAGVFSITTAYMIAFAGLSIYLLSCYFLGTKILLLSPAPAVILIFYSLLKRFTPLCHFGIGLCLLTAPVGAYVAVTQNVFLGKDIALFAGFVFFWMSGFDIIYSLQDVEFDKNNKVNSIPAAIGINNAQIVAGVCHLVSLVFLTLISKSTLSYFAIAACLITYMTAYMPRIPIEKRFFPASAIIAIIGSIIPFL